MAQLGGREVHQARDGLRRGRRPTVMDRVHDGFRQRDQPVDGRVRDGQDRPKTEHRRPRAVVHGHVVFDVVRADHVGTVRGQADGRHGQGHIVHGSAGVLGRNSRRQHTGRVEQRVLPTAPHGHPVGGVYWAAGVVPHFEHRLGRGAGVVFPRHRLGARIPVLPVEEKPTCQGVQMSAVVQVRRRRENGGRAAADGRQREKGNGKPIDVRRGVHQPKGP